MRSPHGDGLSPGDIGDPVADAIRNEQAHTAMPSADERHRTPECDNCDAQNETVARRALIAPDCLALQQPDVPHRLLCEDCDDERPSLREKHRQQAQKRVEADYHDDPVAIAVYGCGRATFVTEEPADDGHPPHMRAPPEAPVQCACGEPLATVELADEDGQFADDA